MSSTDSKSDQLTTEELEVIATLLKYPLLEKIFDASALDNYEKTKRKLNSVVTELERVIRRGAKQDAEKAEIILEAYKTSLKFLDELEQKRRQQAK